jgi:predicted metal-dependent hydrolase
LVKLNPVLLIVDARGGAAMSAVYTPKVSPATRRIPLLYLSDDASARDEALRSGADAVLALHEIADRLRADVDQAARIQDTLTRQQLESDCAQPLPPQAREAVTKFNAGEYYAQHDLFEALWVEIETPVRDLYRAVLQVGVAYYQITRGNYRGARKMLLRATPWLALLPDVCQGVDIAQLRADAAIVQAALEQTPDAAPFDLTLLKPVRLIPDSAS